MENEQIIIVDNSKDKAGMQQLYDCLQEAGYVFTKAGSAKAAAALLTDKRYHLVMTPVRALCDDLMQAASLADVPVMAIAEQELTISGTDALYKAGCADHVTFPVCQPALLARVKAQLRTGKYKRQADEANDYLYNFCMPVYHDFLNNCNNTVMMVEHLQEELKDTLSQKTASLLEMIKYQETQCREIVKEHFVHAQNESQRHGGFVRIAE